MNIISFIGDFSYSEQYSEFLRTLLTVDEDLSVLINSNGGEASLGMASYDVIRGSKNKIKTIGMGNIKSVAFMVFLAGHKRFCFENTEFMIHGEQVYFTEGETITQKRMKEMYFHAEKNNQDTKKQIEIASKNKKEIKKFLDNLDLSIDTILYPSDMIKLGLLDRVIKNLDDL